MKVSIIVPLFNEEKNIQNIYNSIVNNGYNNFEIIFINDGSTDNSANILAEISDKDSRVEVLNQVNSGVSIARNNGLKHVSGDLIMFCDCDDILVSGAIMNMVNAYRKTGAPVVQGCFSTDELGADEDAIVMMATQDILDAVISCCGYSKNKLQPQFLNSSKGVVGKLFTKHAIDHVQFNSSLKIGEDLMFLVEVYSKINKIALLNCHVYEIKPNIYSSTRKYNPALIDSSLRFIKVIDKVLLDASLRASHQIAIDYIKYVTCRAAINASYFHPLATEDFRSLYMDFAKYAGSKQVVDVFKTIQKITKQNIIVLPMKEKMLISFIVKSHLLSCILVFRSLRMIKRIIKNML